VHVHESGHGTYPGEEDERGCRAAGHEHGAPPGARQYTLSGAPEPGRLGCLGRGGRQAADPVGHEVPPVRLALAVLRFSAVRAAARRLFTVASGISSTPATAERLSPEPKARPSTSR
jgi:hypothetical protein